jgi:hypothetical protein
VVAVNDLDIEPTEKFVSLVTGSGFSTLVTCVLHPDAVHNGARHARDA